MVPPWAKDYAAKVVLPGPPEIQEAPAAVQAYVRSRLAADANETTLDILKELAAFAVGEVAEDAARFLDQMPRAGELNENDVEARIGPVEWADSDQPGKAALWIRGALWCTYDYREEVMMTVETANLLRCEEPRVERRQCLLKSVGAAVLWEQGREAPSSKDVDNFAAELREELAVKAKEASAALGSPPRDLVPAAEGELRTHIHDALTVDHDKDFRVLACLPLEGLRKATLIVLRINYEGRLIVEFIRGAEASAEEPHLFWVCIHRGHMRMAQPPPALDQGLWLDERRTSAEGVLDLPAWGWEDYLNRGWEEVPMTLSDPMKGCRCCRAAGTRYDPRPRVVGEFEEPGDVCGSLNCALAALVGQSEGRAGEVTRPLALGALAGGGNGAWHAVSGGTINGADSDAFSRDTNGVEAYGYPEEFREAFETEGREFFVWGGATKRFAGEPCGLTDPGRRRPCAPGL